MALCKQLPVRHYPCLLFVSGTDVDMIFFIEFITDKLWVY